MKIIIYKIHFLFSFFLTLSKKTFTLSVYTQRLYTVLTNWKSADLFQWVRPPSALPTPGVIC